LPHRPERPVLYCLMYKSHTLRGGADPPPCLNPKTYLLFHPMDISPYCALLVFCVEVPVYCVRAPGTQPTLKICRVQCVQLIFQTTLTATVCFPSSCLDFIWIKRSCETTIAIRCPRQVFSVSPLVVIPLALAPGRCQRLTFPPPDHAWSFSPYSHVLFCSCLA